MLKYLIGDIMLILNNIKNLDLDNTITCGQIFRFIKEPNNSYTVILPDRVINIKYENEKLYIESNNENNLETVIKDYLDLDRDYITIINNIKKLDNKISECIDKSIGLKMIKQSPIECIISYIISANNSVRNITNSLNLISEHFGEKVIFKDKVYYLFPNINKLITITETNFRECKVGFRDKYLVNIIKSIYENKLDINSIYSMNSTDSLNYLMKFKGIGMKVASCILLFSYQKFDVYPIDTWVKKFMLEDYNIVGEENIRKYCQETYKEYSGLAIQYMFNTKRNKDM